MNSLKVIFYKSKLVIRFYSVLNYLVSLYNISNIEQGVLEADKQKTFHNF